MELRTAVIGDVGGHVDELARVLVDLGADVNTGTLPAGLQVVQVGDLIHRGPHSMPVLTLVDRFLTNSPGQWTQLVGNHEAQYVQPGGPAFSWPETLDPAGQDMLHDWWDTDKMGVAAHAPTAGPGTIITHAGISPGFAIAANQDVAFGTVTATDMVATLNELPRANPTDLLWQPGVMLTGQVHPFPGPLWAQASHELYDPWFWAQGAGPMPWDQVHGHSSVIDWDQKRWRCSTVVLDQCKADHQARHVTFTQYSGRTITGIDPDHGQTPASSWAPLILHHTT